MPEQTRPLAEPTQREEFLIFGSPLISDAEITEVVDSLTSGWIGTGPKVERFERALEAYVGAPQVRCVGSCTAAMYLALKVSDVGPGDEVIVPTMTWVATANVVEHTGATPVLVDVDSRTGLLDLAAAEQAVTPRTRAIIPVHLAGRPVDLDRVGALAQRHGLVLVEDAAHAIGAEWRGRRIGSHGNLVAFSFYANKNVTTGEGGALACTDAHLANRVARLARQGLSDDAWGRYSGDANSISEYEAVEAGFKHNMTDLQGALGIHQLARLDDSIEVRERQWQIYDEALEALPLALPPAIEAGTRHARHLYQVLVEPEAKLSRDELSVFLRSNRIGSGVHYRAVHLHRYYRERYGIDPAALPVATDLSARTLSLPLGPKVSEQDLEDVVAVLRAGLSG